MKQRYLWIVTVALACLNACNYSVGECWIQGEDGSGKGSGGGDTAPPGGGDFGASPPKQPQDVTNPPPPVCNAIGGYDASLFKFVTTLADDGKEEGGGYQEATVNGLKFVDDRQVPPAFWTCSLWVGMPVRTAKRGKMSAEEAAEIAADSLTIASGITMHRRPAWVPGLFCKELGSDVVEVFKNQYKGLGGSARGQ